MLVRLLGLPAVFVFTAQCCASAVYAVIVCLSVCLPQAGIVLKRLDESSWFLAWRLPFTYPTLFCKEIWVSPEMRVLSSGHCHTLRTWRLSPRKSVTLQANSLSSSTVEFVDDTYTTMDESLLFTTSRLTVTL